MDPNSGLGGGGSGSERTLGADSASIVGNFIPPRGYALSGKIMLSAIIVLFAVVLLLFALHLYIRWHLHRLALRRRRRRLTRRPLIFAASAAAASCGLDPKTLESIPVLSYSTEGYDGEEAVVECAVCLCEFEQGESLRRLPLCGHSFHVECIDMWFHSHATCPLCRAAVEAAAANQPADAAEVSVPAMSTSNACPLCGRGEYGTGSSSAAASGVAEVRINVHSGDDEESKSTGGAMGALRRILSREMSAPPEEGAAPAAEPPV